MEADRFSDPAFEDLDGDGAPELIIFSYSGGAHCCYTVYLIALDSPVHVMAAIEAMNGMNIEKAPVDSILNIPDQSFDYWRAPHSDSPFTPVFYRLREHRLEVAIDRMTTDWVFERPGPTQVALGDASQLRAWMSKPDSDLEPAMWDKMLKLLYSGRPETAWSFFTDCWPPHRPGRDDFLLDFTATLSNSPQWQDVQAARAAVAAGQPLPPARIAHTAPPLAKTPSP